MGSHSENWARAMTAWHQLSPVRQLRAIGRLAEYDATAVQTAACNALLDPVLNDDDIASCAGQVRALRPGQCRAALLILAGRIPEVTAQAIADVHEAAGRA